MTFHSPVLRKDGLENFKSLGMSRARVIEKTFIHIRDKLVYMCVRMGYERLRKETKVAKDYSV